MWEKAEEPAPKPDDQSPKTGDSTLALYGVLLIASAAGAVVLTRKKAQ